MVQAGAVRGACVRACACMCKPARACLRAFPFPAPAHAPHTCTSTSRPACGCPPPRPHAHAHTQDQPYFDRQAYQQQQHCTVATGSSQRHAPATPAKRPAAAAAGSSAKPPPAQPASADAGGVPAAAAADDGRGAGAEPPGSSNGAAGGGSDGNGEEAAAAMNRQIASLCAQASDGPGGGRVVMMWCGRVPACVGVCVCVLRRCMRVFDGVRACTCGVFRERGALHFPGPPPGYLSPPCSTWTHRYIPVRTEPHACTCMLLGGGGLRGRRHPREPMAFLHHLAKPAQP